MVSLEEEASSTGLEGLDGRALQREEQSFGGQRAGHAGAHGIQTHGNIGALPGGLGALFLWRYRGAWERCFHVNIRIGALGDLGLVVSLEGEASSPGLELGEPYRRKSRAFGGRGPRTQAHTGYRRTET